MKIRNEGYYKNEYAKEEELKAMKKQYPAMFANKRASQFFKINQPSDGLNSADSCSEKSRNSDRDIYKMMAQNQNAAGKN